MKDWKPMFQNFSEVTVLDLDIREVEEATLFLEVWTSKYQNGFFTIDSIDRELSGSIFRFEIGWAETEILQFEDFGRQ